MNNEVIEKAKKLGQMLAQSPIDFELKVAILENLPKMPEKYLDALIVSLGNEAKGIEVLIKEADDFLKKQDEDWSKVEADQTALAERMVEGELKDIENGDQIDQVKSKIANLVQ